MSASCARVGTTLLVSMLIHVTSQLNAPHGGTLRPLISDDPATVATLKDESALLMTVRARDRNGDCPGIHDCTAAAGYTRGPPPL
jgi:hypothetical protein